MEMKMRGWLWKAPSRIDLRLPYFLRIFKRSWSRRYFVLYTSPSSLSCENVVLLEYYLTDETKCKRGSIELCEALKIKEELETDRFSNIFSFYGVKEGNIRKFVVSAPNALLMHQWIGVLEAQTDSRAHNSRRSGKSLDSSSKRHTYCVRFKLSRESLINKHYNSLNYRFSKRLEAILDNQTDKEKERDSKCQNRRTIKSELDVSIPFNDKIDVETHEVPHYKKPKLDRLPRSVLEGKPEENGLKNPVSGHVFNISSNEKVDDETYYKCPK